MTVFQLKPAFSTPDEKRELATKLLEDPCLQVLVLTDDGWKETTNYRIEVRRKKNPSLGSPAPSSGTEEEKARGKAKQGNHHQHGRGR